MILLRIPQRAKIGSCSASRKCKRIPQIKVESANCKRNPQIVSGILKNFRILLTVCGFHLQLRISQQLMFTKHIHYFLFIVSTKWSWFHTFIVDSAKLPGFGTILSNSVLAICPKQQRISEKKATLRVPRSIWFFLVAELAHNSQFGLVMFNPLQHPPLDPKSAPDILLLNLLAVLIGISGCFQPIL